jgi:hypothetical protein
MLNNIAPVVVWPTDRTLFQEGQPYDPRFDLRTDAVVVYGVDESLPTRIAGWRARGYRVHLMTGLAWGHYQEYLLGGWDGEVHWDDAQRLADGSAKQHGPDIPYMVPCELYGAYLESLLKTAIDAGVEAIFLEEPEFWSYTGYGLGFERAWVERYGTPYLDPSSSAEAFSRAAELKYNLYRQLIERLCNAVTRHSAGRPGGLIPCYVATHSLLNYAHNRIVSPMSSLRQMENCGGMIAQTWSHTARSQVLYEGRRAEHLFEVAFLEYGSALELARDSKRRLWFLADPVEDSPVHGWDRYRSGYEKTVVASLFYPEVGGYEVMPWPSRVFTGRYPRRPEGPPGDLIAPGYASELLTIANALTTMPGGPITLDCGTFGLGVLMADSLMFRRGGPDQDDPELSAFYGLALPPLMAGMPVRPVSLETVATAGVPPNLRVLLLSYDGMTPPNAAAHERLAAWVHAGHALLLFGEANGPYETLPGWWNEPDQHYGPWPHLHRLLGIGGETGTYRVGSGVVIAVREGPIALARQAAGATLVRSLIRVAVEALGPSAPVYREQAYMTMRRGQYLLATAMTSAPANVTTGNVTHISGRFIDMLDGNLALRDGISLPAGSCAFMLDLDQVPRGTPAVLAASGRVENVWAEARSLRFSVSGPTNTWAVTRVMLPEAPTRVWAGSAVIDSVWDKDTQTALLRQNNIPAGVAYRIEW